MNVNNILYDKFKLSSFREGQKEIITDVLNNQNVLAMLPTGSGKSLCYQLPAYILSGMTIVVSPLLSLMEDQVQQLKSQGLKEVVALNSFLNPKERERAFEHLHKQKIVYVSPEILQSKSLLRRLKKCEISLFVVDEAHCISQWGHEFRTDYLKLVEVRRELGDPPCLAITATATKEVQRDIVKMLELENYKAHLYSVDRPNIAIVIKKVAPFIDEKIEELVTLINNLKGPGIIYASTRNWTQELVSILISKGIDNIAYYHGGMNSEDRLLIQQQFINNELQLICCTSAFGMGINKPNIRYVIHFHFPLQLESYLQEIGRAGRDGENSIAITLYNEEESALQLSLLTRELPSQSQLKDVIQFLKRRENMECFNDYDIMEATGVTEIMWRFIRFHLEELGVLKEHNYYLIKDDHFIETTIMNKVFKRIEYKKKKFVQFQQWLKETSKCRRELVLKEFEERLIKKPVNCCDVCSFVLENYFSMEMINKKSNLSWQEELDQIFSIEETG